MAAVRMSVSSDSLHTPLICVVFSAAAELLFAFVVSMVPAYCYCCNEEALGLLLDPTLVELVKVLC